ASRNVCRVRLVPDVPRESLARTIIEVTKKSPGCNEPGLQGGQLHAPPILSKAQIHIKGCPKNAGRCPKKDPVSGRSRASRGQPPGGRGTLGCLPDPASIAYTDPGRQSADAIARTARAQ